MLYRSRVLPLSAVFVMVAVTAIAASIWSDDAFSGANNPPATVLATAAIDITEPAPTGAIGADSTPVYEALEANGRYYIVGDFDTVGGETRSAIAAIDVATGHVDPTFAPVVTGSAGIVDAIAISPDGADLYIGGRFAQVDGVFRTRVAKLDAITGEVDPDFNPIASGQVETIETDGTSVWIGGSFATINGGLAEPNLVKVDATFGTFDPAWDGTTDLRVRDIELNNGVLWVGGNFTTIAGSPTRFLAPVDPATGNVLATWAPGPDVATPGVPMAEQHVVYDVSAAPDGSAVYVGTRGTPGEEPQAGNAVRKYAPDGELLWQVVGAGDTQALHATNTTVYTGGHGNYVYEIEKFNLDGTRNNGIAGEDSDITDTTFPTNGYVEDPTNLNATRRNKLWALDAATGDLLPWDPNLDTTDGVWGISSGPSGLLVSGDFRTIVNPSGVEGAENGVFSPHFAVFAGLGTGGNAAPQPLFDADCAGTACNFDATASLDDGSIASYAWDFGDGQTGTGQAASAVLADDTTYDVTLTVTDDAGLAASRTQKVVVGSGGLPIEHIGTVTTSSQNNTFVVQLPASAQAGDVAVAFVSVSAATTTVATPDGWVAAGDQIDGDLRTFVFWRSIDANDPGSNASFPASASGKGNLTVTLFRGVDGTTPIVAIDSSTTAANQAEHTSPALNFTGDATVLHYFAEKTGQTTEIFASPQLAQLSTEIGSGTGRVNSALALDPTLRTVASPGMVAVTEHHSSTALGFAVALVAGTPVIPDTTPPSSTIDPLTTTAGVVSITGTATDTDSGVGEVFVRVRRISDGLYWDGTDWVTAAGSWNLATGTDIWSYTLDLTAGNYGITAYAVDNAGNVQTWNDNRPFETITIETGGAPDTTPPVITLTTASPQTPGLVDVEGDVTDDNSGVDRVRVMVRNIQTGEYWNGTTWQASWVWNVATLNGDDTWTVPQVDLSAAGEYQMRMYAWDVEDNRTITGGTDPLNRITVEAAPVDDTTPPVVTLTTASPQTAGLVDIAGDVTDDISGVDRVRVVVRNIQTGEFWNGTTWQAGWVWNLATLNGDDTWTLSQVDLSATGDYQLRMYAWDVENNRAITGGTDPLNRITVEAGGAPDTTPPVITLTTTSPQTPGLVDVEGDVTDDISGVDRVRVLVRNIGTGEYWNGTTWQTGWVWNLATLNGDDTWTVPQVDLSVAGNYQMRMYAWDVENNRAITGGTDPLNRITVE